MVDVAGSEIVAELEKVGFFERDLKIGPDLTCSVLELSQEGLGQCETFEWIWSDCAGFFGFDRE